MRCAYPNPTAGKKGTIFIVPLFDLFAKDSRPSQSGDEIETTTAGE